MNPDRLAALEEERRYLLRSLRDLDVEYEAGDVDDTDYETLRDDYTKRAADVLRSIESGRTALAARPPRKWTTTIATTVAVVRCRRRRRLAGRPLDGGAGRRADDDGQRPPD